MTLADAPDVITVRELAEVLRIGRNEAYRLVSDGSIYAARIGKSLRIPKTAVVAFLEGTPTSTERPELRLA